MADTLAVRLCASLLPMRTRDFHPLELAHAGQTKNFYKNIFLFSVPYIVFFSTLPKLNFSKSKSHTQTLSGMASIASPFFLYMIFFIRFLYAAKISSKNMQSSLHCLSFGRRNLPISILLPSINTCNMDTTFPLRMLVSSYFICSLPLSFPLHNYQAVHSPVPCCTHSLPLLLWNKHSPLTF